MRRRSRSASTRVTSSPPSRMRPVVGSMIRLTIFIVVVLPQPDGPTSTDSSPAAKVRSSWATPTAPSGETLLTPSSRIPGEQPVAGSARRSGEAAAVAATAWPPWVRAARRADQHRQFPGGEGEVELGHDHGAVGVDLADPVEPDLGGVAGRGVRPAQRRGGGSSVHGVASLGALSATSGPAAPVLAADEAPNPWFDPSYVTDNWDTIVGYLGQHVRLTVGAVLLGALIALPLALLARRTRFLAGPVLGLSSVV